MPFQIGVGVCGAGIGQFHIEAYQEIAGVEVLALAGPDTTRCAAVARACSVPRVVSDYRDMLAMPDIQAVSVCVPNKYHATLAVDALNAGKHVLCEKPLAINGDEAQCIVDAARANNRILMVGFNNRFAAHSIALKALIDADHLGPIYYARAGWLRRHGIPGFGGWFTTKTVAGGGALIDIGIHALDLALYYMGYPEPVSVVGSTYHEFGPRGAGIRHGQQAWDLEMTNTFDVEDLAVGMIRFATGATLLVEASWASHIEHDEDFFVHLLGRQGGARVLIPNYDTSDSVRVFTEVAGQPVDIAPRITGDSVKYLYGRETRHFIECIRAGVETLASGEQGLRLMRIVDALYESAATGSQVILDPQSR